jgi:DNA-binding MarR family transcriptional regulator
VPPRKATAAKAVGPDLHSLDEFVLTDVVSHLLRRAHFRAEDLFAQEFGKDGLTPRQKALLITAYQNPGANQNELADKVAIDRNSFAEMLNRMVSNGYVRRAKAKEDARAYHITISQKGIDLLVEVLPRDREVEEKVFAPLPAELRPLFIKCLKIMVGLDK